MTEIRLQVDEIEELRDGLIKKAPMLLQILRMGCTLERPIVGAKLAADIGVKSDEDIRVIVNYLRAKHHLPIGSLVGGGYYWARNDAELEPTYAHLKSRIAGVAAALSGLKKSFASETNHDLFEGVV